MKKELTCIVCPIGCSLLAEIDENGAVKKVSGNTCPRGEAYARSELTHPTRTLTTTVRVKDRDVLLPVKTDRPISKEKWREAMAEIKTLRVLAPVHIGDIVRSSLVGEADLIATADLE